MSIDRSRIPATADYLTDTLSLPIAGKGKWRTSSCPFHGGSDSFRINSQSSGWVCMSCGVHGGDAVSLHMQLHGLDFPAACQELGCWIEDGRPHHARKPAPIAARDALHICAQEVTFAAVAACNMARGYTLTESDRDRLRKAAGRLNTIAEGHA